jgi:hypothetical protein
MRFPFDCEPKILLKGRTNRTAEALKRGEKQGRLGQEVPIRVQALVKNEEGKQSRLPGRFVSTYTGDIQLLT